MRLDLTQEFPVALERLWTMLGHRDYIERRYRALGSTSLRLLKFTADAESIEMELERLAPVALDELPVWARALSARDQAMHHHTRWRRTSANRAEVELDIRATGLRLGAAGDGSIVEVAPGRSRMTLRLEVAGPSPGQPCGLARLFAQQVKHALRADHASTVESLRATSR